VVKAAVEANDAQNKLANTFKNNAILSDSSMGAFTRRADALRDLTGVDDEAIIGAQALLGQFKLTGQQVMDLIPLISTSPRRWVSTLEAAANAVGKATQGSTPEPWPATASRSRTLEARALRSTPSCRDCKERSEASPRSEGQRNPGGYSVRSSRRPPSTTVRLCSQSSKTSPSSRPTNRRPAATCLRCAEESPQLG
jgi:hypothetical protein